ncbi:MAG: YeeE/YedE family protein, partial [Beijerinckiaceae bacterium]|nr:YeeE/YedE family protein [Beijerinckiaceae bacterium]
VLVIPTRRDIDARLITGSLVFGAGWGLAGICPGPAIAALGFGMPEIFIFVAAMLAGMAIYQFGLAPQPQGSMAK